jgi:murein DD-endopeptidase MepM/ murein hydrolase activator NlpD
MFKGSAQVSRLASMAIGLAWLAGLLVLLGAKATPSPKPSAREKNVPASAAKQPHKAALHEPETGARSKKRQPTPARVSKSLKARPTTTTSTTTLARQKAEFTRKSAAATTSTRTRLSSLQLADPYEFSRFFSEWWSLTQVAIQPNAALLWLQYARGRSAQQLAELIAEIRGAYERRRTNARRATVALYLIARLRNQSVAIPQAPLAYHFIALRGAVLADAAALERYGLLEETARRVEAEVLEAIDRKRLMESGGEADSLMVATVEAVARWNEQLLRMVAPADLSPMLDALRQQYAAEKRLRSLTEFAPPAPNAAPAYWPLVAEDLPLPTEPLPPPRTRMTLEKMAPPEREALVLHVAPGRPIHCVADGVVRFAGAMRGLGQVVVVEHEANRMSVYALLGETTVQVGQALRSGDVVGLSSREASQREVDVMFEVRDGAKAVSPRLLLGDRDPYAILVR